jgi:hypothetical protein
VTAYPLPLSIIYLDYFSHEWATVPFHVVIDVVEEGPGRADDGAWGS